MSLASKVLRLIARDLPYIIGSHVNRAMVHPVARADSKYIKIIPNTLAECSAIVPSPFSLCPRKPPGILRSPELYIVILHRIDTLATLQRMVEESGNKTTILANFR
jgi:hypothetical protein